MSSKIRRVKVGVTQLGERDAGGLRVAPGSCGGAETAAAVFVFARGYLLRGWSWECWCGPGGAMGVMKHWVGSR